jgi:hypothetical protein
MKVKELIKMLQDKDPEAEVLVKEKRGIVVLANLPNSVDITLVDSAITKSYK